MPSSTAKVQLIGHDDIIATPIIEPTWKSAYRDCWENYKTEAGKPFEIQRDSKLKSPSSFKDIFYHFSLVIVVLAFSVVQQVQTTAAERSALSTITVFDHYNFKRSHYDDHFDAIKLRRHWHRYTYSYLPHVVSVNSGSMSNLWWSMA